MEQQPPTRPKTGGRHAGTPNKTTAFVRSFFAGVIEEAYDESDGGKAARALLILKIRGGDLDAKVWTRILEYAAGAPPKAVDVTHKGKLTLEQLVAGVNPDADEEGEA